MPTRALNNNNERIEMFKPAVATISDIGAITPLPPTIGFHRRLVHSF